MRAWHLELKPSDDAEVERMQTDCESFFFPQKVTGFEFSLLKYQEIAAFREMFPFIPVMRYWKLREICVKMYDMMRDETISDDSVVEALPWAPRPALIRCHTGGVRPAVRHRPAHTPVRGQWDSRSAPRRERPRGTGNGVARSQAGSRV